MKAGPLSYNDLYVAEKPCLMRIGNLTTSPLYWLIAFGKTIEILTAYEGNPVSPPKVIKKEGFVEFWWYKKHLARPVFLVDREEEGVPELFDVLHRRLQSTLQ